MTNVQRKKGKYLWRDLLSLGFRPETALVGVGVIKANVKQMNLGTNMFDRPNKDAFLIVSNFLLKKLNPIRYNEILRNCWPVLDHKADAEFRKVTCAWLRDIMDGTGSTCPKVVASLLLSPGGPRFTNLMLHLASHVLLKDMKTLSTDATWMAQSTEIPASSVEIAVKRLELVKTKFLKGVVAQHCLLQDYQKQVL
ncbi:HAUS augmin-like complex subunit 6 [Aplochiton taeniatus]